MRRAQVGPRLVGADAGHDGREAGQVAEGQIVGGEQRQGNAHLPDGVGERVARAHDVADGDARGRPQVEDEDARLRGAQQLAALDVVVVDGLHRLAVLASVAPGDRPQGERARVENGGRRDAEAGARLLPLVGEAQGEDGGSTDQPGGASRRTSAVAAPGARWRAKTRTSTGRRSRRAAPPRSPATPAPTARARPAPRGGARRPRMAPRTARRPACAGSSRPRSRGSEPGRRGRAGSTGASRPRGRGARCGRGPPPGASRAATGGRPGQRPR